MARLHMNSDSRSGWTKYGTLPNMFMLMRYAASPRRRVDIFCSSTSYLFARTRYMVLRKSAREGGEGCTG